MSFSVENVDMATKNIYLKLYPFKSEKDKRASRRPAAIVAREGNTRRSFTAF